MTLFSDSGVVCSGHVWLKKVMASLGYATFTPINRGSAPTAPRLRLSLPHYGLPETADLNTKYTRRCPTGRLGFRGGSGTAELLLLPLTNTLYRILQGQDIFCKLEQTFWNIWQNIPIGTNHFCQTIWKLPNLSKLDNWWSLCHYPNICDLASWKFRLIFPEFQN